MKVLLYQGIDHEFFEALEKAADSVPQMKAVHINPDKGSLSQKVFQHRPHIIIVDAMFSYLSEEVRIIRQVPEFRSVVIAVLCNDENETRAGEELLSSGAVLFHLKTTDFETFFSDCCQFAFSSNFPDTDFARARKLEIPLSLGFLSTLTAVTPEKVIMETDLLLSDDVALPLPMAAGGNALMRVGPSSESGITGPYSRSYELDYIFPGPWDSVNENMLSPDTVKTWIDFRQGSFDERRMTVAIYTKNEEFIRKYLNDTHSSWFRIFSSVAEAEGKLSLLRPRIIFYDLDEDEEYRIIADIQDIQPAPLLVISGTDSESAALRKLHNYEYILGWPGNLDARIIHAMENKYLEKGLMEEGPLFLRPGDDARILWPEKDVILTSITERDLTFITGDEIPYFAVLKAALPLPFYLTVVPAEGHLPRLKEGYHYRAIIHGLSEENLAKLRKIVNQLIYRPVNFLTEEMVAVMLKQDYVEKPATAPEEEKEPELAAAGGEERFWLQRQTRGISKL